MNIEFKAQNTGSVMHDKGESYTWNIKILVSKNMVQLHKIYSAPKFPKSNHKFNETLLQADKVNKIEKSFY